MKETKLSALLPDGREVFCLLKCSKTFSPEVHVPCDWHSDTYLYAAMRYITFSVPVQDAVVPVSYRMRLPAGKKGGGRKAPKSRGVWFVVPREYLYLPCPGAVVYLHLVVNSEGATLDRLVVDLPGAAVPYSRWEKVLEIRRYDARTWPGTKKLGR